MLHDVCNASVVRLATLDPREKDSFGDIYKKGHTNHTNSSGQSQVETLLVACLLVCCAKPGGQLFSCVHWLTMEFYSRKSYSIFAFEVDGY